MPIKDLLHLNNGLQSDADYTTIEFINKYCGPNDRHILHLIEPRVHHVDHNM
jgi:hypothetical protein